MRYACEAYSDPEEIDRFLAITRPPKRLPRCWPRGTEAEAWYWSWGLEAVSGIGTDGRAL